jgi:outer membrane biogenesis lipoprotein LolB
LDAEWRKISGLITNSMGVLMRAHFYLAAMASLLLAAGCNNAKSPDTVAKDVANAEQKADKEVTKSEDSAAKDLGNSAEKVDDKMVAFNNAAAKDAYNLAVAQADGNRKVALANCESMSGAAQKTCKDQADADYSAAKANAKAAAQSEKQ